jgi:hypothetical protein
MVSDGLMFELKAYHSRRPILKVISPEESRNKYISPPMAWTIVPVTITGAWCEKVFACSMVTVCVGPVNLYWPGVPSTGGGGGGGGGG